MVGNTFHVGGDTRTVGREFHCRVFGDDGRISQHDFVGRIGAEAMTPRDQGHDRAGMRSVRDLQTPAGALRGWILHNGWLLPAYYVAQTRDVRSPGHSPGNSDVDRSCQKSLG